MNYDLSRLTSRNVASLNTFILDESMCFCLYCGMSDIEYMYTNTVGGYSLIDHFIMSNNLTYSTISYCSLELVDNLSDHLPIQLCLANHTQTMLAETNCVSENRSARVQKPKWLTTKSEDISYYKQRVNFYLSMIELPEH